jgi:hypothetical protein
MIGTSLILTVMVLLVLLFVVMGELSYLAPYRDYLLTRYGILAALLGAALFANLFAAFFTLNRKFLLKDTGRRLSHLDKQIQTHQSDLSAEIQQKFHE